MNPIDRQIDRLRVDLTLQATLLGHEFEFATTWGLFSPREIDAGSVLLLDYLDVADDEVAVDIGCGYGPLGLAIAAQAPRGQVHLLDRDFVAVDYARRNAERAGLAERTEVYLSNGFSAVPEALPVTLVVSNLPAKVGNELLQILFLDARRRMRPGARLVVVTIHGLRHFVKRSFTELFGNYTKLKQGKSYTVSMAERR